MQQVPWNSFNGPHRYLPKYSTLDTISWVVDPELPASHGRRGERCHHAQSTRCASRRQTAKENLEEKKNTPPALLQTLPKLQAAIVVEREAAPEVSKLARPASSAQPAQQKLSISAERLEALVEKKVRLPVFTDVSDLAGKASRTNRWAGHGWVGEITRLPDYQITIW
ncbi:hypothetical protein CFRS1_v015271 [Colletotrichum fructicola]|nr:hypothetical protein CFRS1_v015271 [Colletotrichum fructicola]